VHFYRHCRGGGHGYVHLQVGREVGRGVGRGVGWGVGRGVGRGVGWGVGWGVGCDVGGFVRTDACEVGVPTCVPGNVCCSVGRPAWIWLLMRFCWETIPPAENGTVWVKPNCTVQVLRRPRRRAGLLPSARRRATPPVGSSHSTLKPSSLSTVTPSDAAIPALRVAISASVGHSAAWIGSFTVDVTYDQTYMQAFRVVMVVVSTLVVVVVMEVGKHRGRGAHQGEINGGMRSSPSRDRTAPPSLAAAPGTPTAICRVGADVGAGVKAQADWSVDPLGDTMPGLQYAQAASAVAPVAAE
jgi:hypothetical protein